MRVKIGGRHGKCFDYSDVNVKKMTVYSERKEEVRIELLLDDGEEHVFYLNNGGTIKINKRSEKDEPKEADRHTKADEST